MAQVVETSVKVTSNSPSQDYTHPDDHNLLTYDMTPGFKPFKILISHYQLIWNFKHNTNDGFPIWIKVLILTACFFF